MARGVRKMKSKLAGGIELFSVSDITFIHGRGEIGTLISSRLRVHYRHIVKNLDRVQLGYELIKLMNKATEDHPDADYFELLQQAFSSLDNTAVNADLIRPWFQAQLLCLGGHTPNLKSDTAGQPLEPHQTYNFDPEAMAFAPQANGNFQAGHIKTLRLLFSGLGPAKLNQVQGIEALLPNLAPLIQTMLTSYIRV